MVRVRAPRLVRAVVCVLVPVARPLPGAAGPAQFVPGGRRGGGDQYGAGRQQQRLQPGLDVPQVEVAEPGVQQRHPGQQQHDGLRLPVHNITAPVTEPRTTATAKVAGANRTAKARPKAPA